eukprot:CAMPEP_0198287370 /NCGR_PEP_ID=MMETSP1449-20131203/6215_1 /TAXON_ID=420275 /ORGANISM="Attheya septentrionalis, Strain CCMP2084" /LENGTH=407 /DNA_ID=CAMNT_0043985317 /DNA_START=52 /DNA_END=1275 /DNA_ORIENTATION=-
MSSSNDATSSAGTGTGKVVRLDVIGDAFVDLLCVMEPDAGMPEPGGDTRLASPVRTMAGGSALNTATHLASLCQSIGGHRGHISLGLQAVWNEGDEHGKLLEAHANRWGIRIKNCRTPEGAGATGHCIVIVSGNGERSFLTHLGCVAHFCASHLDIHSLIRTNNLSVDAPTHSHHQHVHVAGYYNIPKFWNGNLQSQLHQIREERSKLSGGTTSISLVPQHDATGQWDGDLCGLLPLVDFLILNQVEAKAILDRHGGSSPEIETDKTTDADNVNQSDESKENDELQSYLEYAARGFFAVSPNTRVIVTCGSKGAAALHEGQLVCFQPAPRLDSAAILDTTGAGDAFAAAFLHRILQLPNEHSSTWPSSESLKDALRWGCAVGTASVTKVGASIPSSQKEIELLIADL